MCKGVKGTCPKDGEESLDLHATSPRQLISSVW